MSNTITIIFPEENYAFAACLGQALSSYGAGHVPAGGVAVPGELATTLAAEQDGGASVASEPVAPGSVTEPTDPPAGEDDGPADPPRLDANGVAFDPEFCGEAKEPFYTSGARAGQWKKRRGLDENAYDEWYGSQRIDVAQRPAPLDGEPVDASAAFAAPAAAPASGAQPVPTSMGDFMGWVADRKAAGLTTEDQVAEAYRTTGIQVVDLLPPAEESVVSERIARLIEAIEAA